MRKQLNLRTPSGTKCWHNCTRCRHHGAPEDRKSRHRQAMIELEMAEQLRSGHAGVPSEDEEQQQQQLLNRIYTLPERTGLHSTRANENSRGS